MTARTATPEVAPTRFDSDRFDELCAGREAATPAAKAALAGIDESTLWRLRKGQTPRLDTARRIAQRLDVTIDELWPAA
jgi:transcriptional regulator with XRE-family HTH domain